MPHTTTSILRPAEGESCANTSPKAVGNSGGDSLPIPLSEAADARTAPISDMPQARRLEVPQSTATHAIDSVTFVLAPGSTCCAARP